MILPFSNSALGAGVTIITHGFGGNVADWIIPMAEKIPQYYRFFGTNFSCYEIDLLQDSQGNYVSTQREIGGVLPTGAESGEIIVKLDWSQLAGTLLGSAAYSTTELAPRFASALLSTNFIPQLGGRPLVELPLHFVGHSRGGSMICEIARLLGAQGVWVDHLTTLDPHPLNNDGFDDTLETFTVDAPARIFANVLFADNYYQQNSSLFGIDPSGERVAGAYNRYLSNLIYVSGVTGGYGNVSSSHSDVHLWYHGTIDSSTPTSDTQANITEFERKNWWFSYESRGAFAGFYYSLIGRGNRLAEDEPAGPGTSRIADGYNQAWDFGAGVSGNRFRLPSNDGSWPNIIKLNITGKNIFAVGQSTSLKYFYQFGQNNSQSADLQFYLDNDLNPWNANASQVYQATVSGSGTNFLRIGTNEFTPNPVTTIPGIYAIYGKITFGGRTRYLYAPELVQLKPSLRPPLLKQLFWTNNRLQFNVSGLPGQTLSVQRSADFRSWTSIATNTLSGFDWVFSDLGSGSDSHRFYRVVLLP